MQLDKRSSKLFDELMSNPGINSKELEEKYDLTRRQLGYSFNKINDWLLMKNLPEIERTRQGHFIIDQSLITKMSDEQEIDLSDMNILSESQRVYMIMLMLLSSEEELSLKDRKSTRLNSSHVAISYAVFCLKKKKNIKIYTKNRINQI